MSNNEWFERGELPPVGVECEINWGIVSDEEKKFHEIYNGKAVKIVGHDEVTGSPVAVFRLVKDFETKPYYSLVAECFRPLKTERERAIDAAREILKLDEIPWADRFGMLYDAGCLKVPE